MAVRVWGRTADKKIKFLSLSAKYLPGALSIYRDSFFVNEAVHKVIGIAQSDKASRQVLSVFEVIAQNGVSVVAVEEDTDKVVGAAINRIQVTGDTDFDVFFEEEMQSEDSEPGYKELLRFLSQMEEKVDIFEHYGITTIMDHMFLVTHHEYYQQGIGRGLVAATVEVARALNRGEDVAVPVSYESYPWKNKLPPKVQAVIGLFTSPISQKIAQSLGWDEIFIVKYDQLFYNGKSYGSRLHTNNQATIYMAIRTET